MSTLKHSWSWLGQHHPRLLRGELCLWPDRLEFVSRGDGRSMPLRNVTGLALVPAPQYGWRRRAKRLAVVFQDGPEELALEFDFKTDLFTSRSVAENHASEWLAALTKQISALTGAAAARRRNRWTRRAPRTGRRSECSPEL